MDDSFWLKQGNRPLFPDVAWNRPEQKSRAKKLLIIGGHPQGFDQVGRLYQAAINAGVGQAKVVLPLAMKRLVGTELPDTVFAELTPDTSATTAAVDSLRAYTDWSDGVVFIQTGNNSHTALLLGGFLRNYTGPLIVTDDLLQILAHDSALLTRCDQTIFVLSFSGLQALVKQSGSELGFRHDMGLRPFVLGLKQLSSQIQVPINVVFEQEIVNAYRGQIVTTTRGVKPDPTMLAGWMSTWWLQQPGKPLETLAAVVMEF